MLGYYATRLALLPGIVLHELSHYYFCRAVGAQVHEVCIFSFGEPAGYVIHTAPRRFRAHCAIVMGPLLVNSTIAIALFCSAIASWRALIPLEPIAWAPYVLQMAVAAWLGLVIALQALPSDGDAISLWQVAKWHKRRPVQVVSYPIAVGIRFANWLRGVWIDWAYTALLGWAALRLTGAA